MSLIKIFDPALCCSSGVCGVDIDPSLARFSADMAWAQQTGATIERFNLAQQPLAFADEPAVQAALEASGEAILPLVLVDGEITLSGRYPSRDALARWAGISPPAIEVATTTAQCCSGNDG